MSSSHLSLELETPTPSETPEPGSVEQGKSLVVYFSRTDTTKKIAEYIQENTGADIYRIEAEVPYTAEDLNHGDASTRAANLHALTDSGVTWLEGSRSESISDHKKHQCFTVMWDSGALLYQTIMKKI